MKRFRLFMFSLHRVLGAIISLFFLMWFISGLVLLYHPFPNVTKEQKYSKSETLPSTLPPITDLLERIPRSSKITKIRARQFQGQTLFLLTSKDTIYTLTQVSTDSVKPITGESIKQIVKRWSDASILKVDTLYERDQWIMYTRYLKEMPIYKFYLDDPEKHQLYIASKTGEVLQYTNTKQRFWAWVGAIPHTFYFPLLRKHTDLWIMVLTIAGTVGLIVSLTGVYLGSNVIYKRYKHKNKIGSPYKKRWYWWHHLSGIVFGIFLATWSFSGAMSLQKVPQWLVKTHENYKISSTKIRGKKLSSDKYLLDYRSVKEIYPNLKEIEWSNFQSIPIYNIIEGNQTISIDATTDAAREVFLSEKEISKSIQNIHGDSLPLKISFMNEYDEYYLSRENTLALPVYKVEVADADHSIYYINPKNGDYKYVNQNRKTKKWIFSGLHYLNIKFFIDRPVLWTISIWFLCMGGIVVCLTGVWLSGRFMTRKAKHLFKKRGC